MSSQENGNYLMQAAINAGIRNPKELANFMGQMQVESGEFSKTEENLHYSGHRLLQLFRGRNGLKTSEQANAIAAGGPEKVAEAIYGGKWGNQILGNAQEGDGWKYHGRGFIQLTGRNQYKKMSDALGIDLINHPERAAEPEVAAQIAVQYWKINVVARKCQNDVIKASYIINGGHNGLEARLHAEAVWEKQLLDNGYPSDLASVHEKEYTPRATLHQGAHGAAVVELQQQLQSLGYYTVSASGQPLIADGRFDQQTHDALVHFQRDHGLAPNGVADPQTETELHATELRAMQPHQHRDSPGAQQGKAHQPPASTPDMPSPTRDLNAFFDRMIAAAEAGEQATFRKMAQMLTNLPSAQQLKAEAVAAVDRFEARNVAQQGQPGHPAQPTQPTTPAPPGATRAARATPADPGHPDHALYKNVRQRVASAYAAEKGVPLPPEQLDNLAAAVTANARKTRMTEVASVIVSTNRMQPDVLQVFAYQGRPGEPGKPFSMTPVDKAINTPIEQSWQRFDQVTAQNQAADLERQQAQPMSQQRGHSI